jgi:hypothetical protein
LKKQKKIIEENKNDLDRATLGMYEDWFWTGEDVWVNGEFVKNLDACPEIVGIRGSTWATPTLRLLFKDGTDKCIDVSDKNEEDGKEYDKPYYLTFGPLSEEVDQSMPPLENE